MRPAAVAERLTRADAGIAALLFLASLTIYGALAWRLAAGRYYEFYNLAFDFDPVVTWSVLTNDRAFAPPYWIKHPFMPLFRPFAQVIMAAGAGAKLAAGLVMAATGAATLVVVFLFLRSARIGRAESAALAVLVAVTGTQMLTAIITETYGFAGLTLALVWLLAQRSLSGDARLFPARCVVAALTAGVTITNGLPPVIAELLVAWRRRGLRAVVAHMTGFGLVAGAVFAATALVLWHTELWAAAHEPVRAMKAVWYLQTKGPTTGALKVVQTFLAFSFVSPVYSVVPLEEGTRMVDFREWVFPGAGGIVVWAWLAFLATGAAAGLAHPTYRPIALAIAATLVANIVFHLGFQFRSSVYIYAAHTHFLVFALAAGLGPWVLGRPRARAGYVAAVLTLAAAIACVNGPVAIDFSQRFDVPATECLAPCTGL